MSICRHIATYGLCAVLLTGCVGSGFPDIPASFSPESRDAPWPDFLPIEAILATDMTDFDQALAEIRTLQYRAVQLRRRARLLKGPVIEAQERLRQLNGSSHP